MDLNSFTRPENTNYSLHNNLLSSVSTPRTITQVPSIMTKEITPIHLVQIKKELVDAGYLQQLICLDVQL